MFRRGAWILLSLALLAGACGSGASREDGVKQLVDQGMSQPAAECFFDELEAAGFNASDMATDNPSDELRRAGEQAMANCASGDDLTALLQDSSLDDEAVRNRFVEGMVSGAGGTIDRAQAECITDYIIDQGVTLADITQAGVGNGLPPEMQDLINAAVGVCVQP